MAGKAGQPRRSLREQAIELGRGRPGYKSRVDVLLDSVPEDERVEVLDVLEGEPLLPHAAVAAILTKNYPKFVSETPIRDRNIMDWRRSRGISIKQRLPSDG